MSEVGEEILYLDNDTERLNYYERYYQNFNSSPSPDLIPDLISKIMISIHDNWSEIRKIAFKGLLRFKEYFSEEIVIILFTNFMNFDGKFSWQYLHGNLLGISAILSKINSEILLEEIQKQLFQMLSHDNLPIREVAEDTLLQLMKRTPTKLSSYLIVLLKEIECQAKLDINDSSEFHSNFLYSSLGLVAGLLADSERVDHDFIEIYVTTIELCLSHRSTTVRIQAAQTVKSLYEKSYPLYNSNHEFQEFISPIDASLMSCISVLVDAANNSLCNASDLSQWHILEGYLLIIEDILLRLSLSALTISLSATDLPIVTIFFRVIPPLQAHLPSLISHPIFEITRLVSQIIPSLGRACLLHDLPFPSKVFSPIEFMPTEVQLIWDLEILKTLSLIFETLPLSIPQTQTETMSNSFLTSLKSLLESFSFPKWSNIIRRRLTEADRQKLFLQLLSNSSMATFLNSLFTPLLVQQWICCLLQLCDRVLLVFHGQIVNRGILSLDSIQLIAYLLSLLNWLSPYDSSSSLTISLVSRNLFHSVVLFLATFQHHHMDTNHQSSSSSSDLLVNLLKERVSSSQSESILCIDTITSCSHLTIQQHTQSTPQWQTFDQFFHEKQITPNLFRKYLWDILTPLFPLLTNFGLLSNPSNCSKERQDMLSFISLILLNSSTLNDFQVICDVVWSCCHYLIQSDQNIQLTLLYDIINETGFISFLQEELQKYSHDRSFQYECVVMSLICMITKLVLPEQRQLLYQETRPIYDIICSRAEECSGNQVGQESHPTNKEDEDGKGEDEFSDWDDESEDTNQNPPLENHYFFLLRQFIRDYDELD